MPELRPLTSIRALFAWGVVLYHIRLAGADWLPAAAMRVLSYGYVGVDVFFVLSGFVIWLTYGARLADGRATGDFLVARIARIWPLHLAMLGLCIAIAIALIASGRPPPPKYPFATLPLHVALVQAWGFHDPLEWNDPAWSISAELAAYLLAPFAARALPRAQLPAAVLALLALAPLLALHLAMTALGARHLSDDVATTGVLRCLLEFPAGALLAAAWRRRHETAVLRPGVAWIAAAGTALALAAGASETLAVPVLAAALVLAIALSTDPGRRGGPGERAAHRLGLVSYATYLAHMPLWTLFKLAAVQDADHVAPAPLILYLALVLVASFALYHGLERPAQRRIRAWWAGRPGDAVRPLRSPRSARR